MKKIMVSVFGVLFVAMILIIGCGKSEEKKPEAPPAEEQTSEQDAVAPTQEKAAVMRKEVVEEVEPAVELPAEKAATVTEQAIDTAKEMGQEALEGATEKISEEVQEAVETVKQHSGELTEKSGTVTGSGQMEQAATEEAKTVIEGKAPGVEIEPVPKDAGTSLEETIKDKAGEQGMKLP